MKPLIVANWKMNPSDLAEAEKLFALTQGKNVVICPPFVYLSSLGAKGAQDCFWLEKGAYTGEISPLMLKNLGVEYVLVGHSERRKYLRETDQMVNQKVKALLYFGLKPILCIANLSQLARGLKGVAGEVIVAYEPVFAIGTGKACSLQKARRMREKIGLPFVLYGGSVNSENALGYLEGGYQGLLIGGASLCGEEFLKIIEQVV